MLKWLAIFDRWFFGSRIHKACLKHDKAYWEGGDWSMKLTADDLLWDEVAEVSKIAADAMYRGVRVFSYNFPPGHPNRSKRVLTKDKAWNWRLTDA